MREDQLYEEIYKQKEQLSHLVSNYWNSYSSLDSWFFWFNIASVIVPLIILYFKIDKSRLFEICFFGYSVHVLWSNVDSILSKNNYLVHPHTLSYLFPVGITVTAVIFPVTFMLIYQYCRKKEKNFYLYATIGSIVFAFGFGGFSDAVDLLRMAKGMNLMYLFLIDIAVVFTALWMTKLFQKFKDMHGSK